MVSVITSAKKLYFLRNEILDVLNRSLKDSKKFLTKQILTIFHLESI